MSDEPFFPSPSSPAQAAVTPYRAPGAAPAPPTSPPREQRPGTSRSEAKASSRTELIEELIAARARQKRAGAIAIVVGVALTVGGVAFSFFSRGQMVFYGAIVAGVLGILRGTMSLVSAAMRS